MATEDTGDSDWADPEDSAWNDEPTGGVATEDVAPPETETPAPDVESVPSGEVESDADDSVEAGKSATPESKSAGEVQTTGAEKPTQQFPAELLNSLGLTEAQAKQQFGTPEQLEAAVRFHDQQMMNRGRQAFQAERQPQPPAQSPPPATQPPSPQATAPADAAKKPTGFEPFQFNPDEWDPATAKLLNGLNEHFGKQFEQLANVVQPVQQHDEALRGLLNIHMQQAQADYVREFESQIASLGDEWSDVLGKGDGMKMDRQSPQIQNRIKLDESMLMLARGRRESGLPPLSQKELFDRALRLEFPNKTTALVQKQVVTKSMTRAKQFTNRPTGRNGKPLSGEEAAAARADAFYQERGIGRDESDSDLGDALL